MTDTPPPPRSSTPNAGGAAPNPEHRPATPLTLTQVPTSCSSSQSSQQHQSPTHQQRPQPQSTASLNHTTTTTSTSANIIPSTTSSQHSQNNSQQFCLRWNNYQTNLTSVFDQLLQNESFVDVTLACDGHSIKAHKMVLSACSPYFQGLFFDNPCQHPIIIMRDVKWPELKAAVEFMYKGEINVSQDQIGPLLRVAEMLKIRGLADVTGDPDLNATTATPRRQRTPALPPQISATTSKKPRLTPKEWDMMDGSRTNSALMASLAQMSAGGHSTVSSAAALGGGGASIEMPFESHRHRKRRWPSTEINDVGSPMHTLTPDHIDGQSPVPPNNSSNNNNNNNNSNNNNSTPATPSSIGPPHPPSTPTPMPPSPFPIPPSLEAMGLSSLVMSHPDDMEIKPGIAEMIREEERVSYKFYHNLIFAMVQFLK